MIYPRFPALESEKTAINADLLKDRFEVGDTVIYMIRTRNTVSESVVENLVMSDVLQEGLTYVEGSLNVNHDGESSYEDGTITANFGDVTDTEWRTVTFRATIDSGYAEQTIENIAVVDGSNIDEPDEPSTEFEVEPKDPVLESEKAATLLEKADGNTDEDHPEVGDTLLYTIQTRNTIEDSLVRNLIIRDALPEGLEYVPGTLEVDGDAVTDTVDDDAGHYDDGVIVGQFGDVRDTDWHTVTFQVTIGEGQASQDIENIATVDGDNIDEPDEPSEEVLIYPRVPNVESEKTAENLEEGKENFHVGDTVVYTIRARNTVRESVVENFVISDALPEGLSYVDGSLDVSHDGEGSNEDGTIIANFGNVTDTEWRTITFHAVIDAGQAEETIENVATVDGGNVDPENPQHEITVDPKDPQLESEKTAELVQKAAGNTDADHPEVGDTLLYTIQTRNTIEDSIVKNLIIRDELPEGLEYVPGTLEVDGIEVTDEEDGDAGHYVDGEMVGQFGDVRDTDWHTVTFQVTVGEGQASQDIENIATVDGDNIDEPDRPSEEVMIYPRHPVLESEKTAINADLLKDRFEVGDTVIYMIRTRNTVSESVVQNLVISDVLQEGLTYVEGSLNVSHDGEGSYEDGTITANFGDVTDTEWRTATFRATIDSGYAEQTIENIAVVDGSNIDEPDEPSTNIEVEPKDPVLESEKTATNLDESKDRFEVGDTVIYTVRTHNTIEDSLVENLTITDTLPEGLTYVDGSLDVSHDGEGSYGDGTITANFGDVTDTEWRTATFRATIDSGYAEQTIENIAVVDGSNIPQPEEPSTDIEVELKDPVLESEKTANLVEKGEGNTDEENAEVGDTLLYTIQTRNTVEDSLVKNLIIRDELPEGLTYVPGTLEVDGEAVTDAVDDDAGHYDAGEIVGQFGDVSDTDWHTVTFQVTVGEGQASQDIENIATVDGDNIDEPDHPSEEVLIYPREPSLDSDKVAENLEEGKEVYHVGDTVVYTITARNTVRESVVENFTISDQLPEGLRFVEGSLEVRHGGTAEYEGGTITATFGEVTDTDWRTVTFQAVIESGQVGSEIENVATVSGDNVENPETPEHTITIDPKTPQLESEKEAELVEKAEENTDVENPEVGDTLLYTIQARNTVEDSLVKNLIIHDELPEGLNYVPGTLMVDGEAVTDEEDGDAGYYVDGEIVGQFGDVSDTDWHTVTFQVTVGEGQASQDIENIATVDGDNIDEPDHPSEVVLIYPREPNLESEKTSANLEEGKEDFHTGDTVVYTIRARNTVGDSVVENLVLSDVLPDGLRYVEGSLEVSNGGTGDYADGVITASFGDVSDTDWRMVTFQATIESDQSGNTIENVATVEADNVGTPGTPSESITVEKEPTPPPQEPEGHQPEPNPEVKPQPEKPEDKGDESKQPEETLPNTATNNFNIFLLGFILLLAGAGIVYWRRKKVRIE